jgi:ABC-type multidrug transport system fused ATPase/permease subunit
VIGLVAVVVFESVLNALRAYVFSHTTSRIDVELGARLFRHLLALPLAYFQARRVGDSVARVRELEHIRSFLTGSSLTLVLDVLFSVIFVGVMLLYSVPLTLIVLASLPLYVGLSLAVVPLLRRRLDEKFSRGAANQALLVEAITGIQTVKASALEPQLSKRWDDQLAAYVVERTADVVTENANEGTDTVQTSVTLTLSYANVENLTLLGSSAISGTGNTLANVLTGNSANNTLSGLGGNDTYIGGAGNDTLTDNSTTSNDIYRWGIGQGNDTISDAGGSGDRIEIAAGVTSSQVTLTRSGNNLLVGITGATDVLTVANWYVGTANKIEEVRLADGTVIGAGAAPLSLARLPSPSERMFRLADPTLSASPTNVAALLTSAQSLVQAMAQFDAGAGADQPWVPQERYDQWPMMHVGW